MSTQVVENRRLQLFADLPNEFTRREALEKAIKLGRSRSWLWERLEEGLILNRLQRIEHGKYRKTLDT